MKNSKNIFVIWGGFPPAIGGGSARGYRIYKELADRGYKITVFVSKSPNSKIYERINPNLEIIRIPPAFHHFLKFPRMPKFNDILKKSKSIDSTKKFTNKNPSHFTLRKYLNISLNAFVKIIRCTLLYFFLTFFYIKRRPKIIIKEATTWDLGEEVINYLKMDFYFLKSWLILKKITKIPLLSYFTDMWVKNEYYIKSCSRDDDAIIIVDEWMEKRIHDIGIKKDIYYVPVSIKTDDYSSNNSNNSIPENKILFVGRLSTDRGCDVLIKAVSFIIDKADEFEVLIVGSGGRKKELEELAKVFEVEKYIKFIGEIDPREIKKVYDNVKVFVNPLRDPGIGNVTIEALASGVPVVKSKYEGFPEYPIENGKNGYTFNVDDAEDLSDKIIKVLKDKNWDALSKNARETAKNFDIKKINDEFEGVILKYMAE